MTRRRSRHQAKQVTFHRNTIPGSAPGQIIVDPTLPPPQIHIFAYGESRLIEECDVSVARVEELRGQSTVIWVNVAGLGDAQTISDLGRLFHLHPLALEDVIHVHQRPKLEPYAEQLFIVARMVSMNATLHTEQVSLFLGPGYVLTFIEDPGDVFDQVRVRLRASSGRIRSSTAAYLAYALLDAVIDGHFPVLEELGDRLEALEDQVVFRPQPRVIAQIHDLKRQLRLMRHELWPLREVCAQLARERLPWIDDDVRVYLRDCYDHTVQILDLLDTCRELAADLTDLYLSSQSHRMNEVMKVLTIIATLFMPLSFVVGIYGMNFDTSQPGNMPELSMPYAYPVVWAVIIAISVGMLSYFWRKGWIGSTHTLDPHELGLPGHSEASGDRRPGA